MNKPWFSNEPMQIGQFIVPKNSTHISIYTVLWIVDMNDTNIAVMEITAANTNLSIRKKADTEANYSVVTEHNTLFINIIMHLEKQENAKVLYQYMNYSTAANFAI